MAPTPAEEKAAMEAKLDAALEINNIDTETLTLYFKLSTRGKEVRWMPLSCKKCGIPLYVHVEECGARVRVAKQKATAYVTLMRENATIKEEVE